MLSLLPDVLADGIGVALFLALVLLFFERLRGSRLKRKNEQERQSLVRRLTDLLTFGNDAVLRLDADGRILEANDRAVEMYGYALSEFLQMNVRELRSPEQRATVGDDMQRAAAEDGIRMESVHLRRDGTSFAVDISARPVTVDGRLQFQDIIRDISLRREAEIAVREGEERLRSITLAAKDAIVMLDDQGLVTFWNRAAEELFGYRADEMLGRDLHTIVVPERVRPQHRAAFPLWQKTGRGGAVNKTVELEAIGKDMKELAIEVSLSSLKVRDRWNAIAIIRDVSARNQANLALREAKDAAEAASARLEVTNAELERAVRTAQEMTVRAEAAGAAKGEFLANMSHEIRTPMNGIIGMTGLLLDTPLGSDQREYAEIVRSSAHALLSIVNDVLDFSKIEAGRLDLDAVGFDLADTIQDTIKMFALQAREKGLQLTCLVDAKVPTSLRGDPGRLRQVLLNLIGNAVKFTAAGEVAVRVGLDVLDHERATLRFSVRDTGIGIPPGRITSLFQSFSQVDSSITRKFGGTGLGLAISKRLVDLMGGQIGVDSATPDGSTFWFTTVFELQTGTRAVHPRPPSDPRSLVVHQGRQRRALVADDNAVNQKLAVRLLEHLGFTADTAANGLEALRALDTAPYDLVLMDVQMPEMDGFGATRAIRQRETETGSHIPVIAMTAGALKGDRERCIEAGMDGYVSKPIERIALARAIEESLGGASVAPLEAPVHANPAPEVFEREVLLARVEGDAELVAEMIAAFLEDVPGIRSRLAQARDAGQVRDLTRLGHLLKGTAATLGAPALMIAAAELERAGKAEDPGRSRILAAEVDRQCDRLILCLSALDVAV